MDPLSVTASIITVLQVSGKVLGYLNDAKDASKTRTQCTLEMMSLCSLLYKLRDHVNTGDPNRPRYTGIGALAAPNGPLDQFKQALEALQTRLTDGGRLNRAGEVLVWKFKKEEIASILGQIERLKTQVEIALQMNHLQLSQTIKDDTNFVRTHVPTIQSGVDRIRQGQADAEHRKMVEWISLTDYPAQQSDNIGRRQEGTGQWFLDAPEVARWLGEPNETLFCPGIPGAGKTMVAAIAIDHLLDSVKSSLVGVTYVYCNYKAQEEHDASSMLAAIIKQLVQGRPSMMEPVERLHEQHASHGTKPSIEEIFGTLQEVVAKYLTVYVVIDALDECRDSDRTRQLFLKQLRDLQTGQDVRLMITSSLIPEIEGEFEQAGRLEVSASNEDVRRFVAGQMYRLPKCIQRDPALQQMVQEKIPERLDGMFLLARLHIDALLDKMTAKKVKIALANLSNGSAALDDAYKDALQRIKCQSRGHYELAKRVLSWITYAKRTLTTAEICHALAVELEDAELEPENIPDVDDLLSVCAGLVFVDRESSVIRLVHYTMQEYFERTRDTWYPGGPLYIASTCLTYLSFDLFKTGSCSSDEEFEERLRENKLLDYAAKYWGEHIVTVEADVCALACSFLSNSYLVSSATQASSPTYEYLDTREDFPRASTGLHLAVRSGLSVTLEAMLSYKGQERATALEQRDSYGQTPLYLAAKNRHCGIVDSLLRNGGDSNAQGGRYGNALQVASYKGYEAAVKLLVDNGADVDAKSGLYGNALYAASKAGHEAIVKLLVNNGANVDAGSRPPLGKALFVASYNGHEAIVKLLVDKGADVYAGIGPYANALYAASNKGYEAIVKLLLEHGADVNAQGNDHPSALRLASEEGHEATVRVLLENGTNLHAQLRQYRRDLRSAKDKKQREDIFREKGVHLHQMNQEYRRAVKGALANGHVQVASLLQENNPLRQC